MCSFAWLYAWNASILIWTANTAATHPATTPATTSHTHTKNLDTSTQLLFTVKTSQWCLEWWKHSDIRLVSEGLHSAVLALLLLFQQLCWPHRCGWRPIKEVPPDSIISVKYAHTHKWWRHKDGRPKKNTHNTNMYTLAHACTRLITCQPQTWSSSGLQCRFAIETTTISPSCSHLYLLNNDLMSPPHRALPTNNLAAKKTNKPSLITRSFTSQCVMRCRDSCYQILVFVQDRSIAQPHIAVAGPGFSTGCWDFEGHLLLLNTPATVTESPSVLSTKRASRPGQLCSLCNAQQHYRETAGGSGRARERERGGFNCRVGRAS